MEFLDALYGKFRWAPTVSVITLAVVIALGWRKLRFVNTLKRDLFSPDAPIIEPMLVSVAIGALLGTSLLSLTRSMCAGRAIGTCGSIWSTPPWILVSGVVAAPPILLTWYWGAAHKQLEIRKGQKDAELAREAQITDRFMKAVGLLGASDLFMRIGGIYALERIFHDSARDQWTIVETLASFARQAAALPLAEPGVPADLQGALTVLGRVAWEGDEQRRVNLRGATMVGADMRAAQLEGAVLAGVLATDVALTKANLKGANLEAATLLGANLDHATLTGTNLKEAKLDGASLEHADFTAATMSSASLRHAKLAYSTFARANLAGATIEGNTDSVDFSSANLCGADLSGIDPRTTGKFACATYDDHTTLPPGWNHALHNMVKL